MKRLSLLALFAVILIAIFFRTYDFKNTPPGLYPDEAMNGSNILEAKATGSYKVFYPENNGREGLFINIQAITLNLIGERAAWVLRLPSAIFGILTVIGVYFLAREMFDETTALMAALFIATAHWHVIFSHIGLRVISAPFFLTWSLAFLWIAFRKLSETQRLEKARPFFLISGLLYGLGFHSYIAYRSAALVILIPLAFFIYECRRANLGKECRLGVITFAVIALIVAAPLIIYFAAHPDQFVARAAGLSVFSKDSPLTSIAFNLSKTLGMLNVQGDLNWRHNVSGQPELFLPVGILFWVGVVIGVRALVHAWRNREGKDRRGKLLTKTNLAYATLFGWLVLTTVPVVLSNERLPHALRSLLMVPALIIFAAVGASRVIQLIAEKASQKWAVSLALALAIVVIAGGYRLFFIDWARNPNLPIFFGADYVQTANEINALPDDVPKYLIIEARGMVERGIPMPAETIVFLTDTFDEEKRDQKQLYFVAPSRAKDIPPGSHVWTLKDIPSDPLQ